MATSNHFVNACKKNSLHYSIIVPRLGTQLSTYVLLSPLGYLFSELSWYPFLVSFGHFHLIIAVENLWQTALSLVAWQAASHVVYPLAYVR